jgi:hypothetical protein
MDSKENAEKGAPFSPANCLATFFTWTVARMMPSLLARYRFFSHDHHLCVTLIDRLLERP